MTQMEEITSLKTFVEVSTFFFLYRSSHLIKTYSCEDDS